MFAAVSCIACSTEPPDEAPSSTATSSPWVDASGVIWSPTVSSVEPSEPPAETLEIALIEIRGFGDMDVTRRSIDYAALPHGGGGGLAKRQLEEWAETRLVWADIDPPQLNDERDIVRVSADARDDRGKTTCVSGFARFGPSGLAMLTSIAEEVEHWHYVRAVGERVDGNVRFCGVVTGRLIGQLRPGLMIVGMVDTPANRARQRPSSP
jgi:hypothetical protein